MAVKCIGKSVQETIVTHVRLARSITILCYKFPSKAIRTFLECHLMLILNEARISLAFCALAFTPVMPTLSLLGPLFVAAALFGAHLTL